MKRALFLAAVPIAICCATRGGGNRPAGTKTELAALSEGSEAQVISLVNLLASPVPVNSKFFQDLPGKVDSGCLLHHPQVWRAKCSLVAMGTEIYPILVKHLDDDRFSYTISCRGFPEHSVGGAVRDVLAEGIEFYDSGYKSRDNPDGHDVKPNFAGFLRERDLDVWATRAAKSCKADLRKEYVRWYIKKERSYGFKDQTEESWILQPYLAELARLERESPANPRVQRARPAGDRPR